MSGPDFAKLSKIEERVLLGRLDAVRGSISHPGEKGRSLEFQVLRFVRDLLPPEYGLTTGFIVWMKGGKPEISTQLDIIIFDAVRYSPVIRLEGCDVVPLEAVYGYIEVKASLRVGNGVASKKKPAEDSLLACAIKNAAIREMRTRSFWLVSNGSPQIAQVSRERWLAPRAYVVAFSAMGAANKSADAFAGRMANTLHDLGTAHIHGVLIPEFGFFYTVPDTKGNRDDDRFHVKYTVQHAMLAFKSALLQGLSSFPRPDPEMWPATHLYFEADPIWIEKAPIKGKGVIEITDKVDTATQPTR